MGELVSVIVDVPAAEVDKTFTYCIPPRLQEKLEIGTMVRVPFGRRVVNGFVVGFPENTDLARKELKEIKELGFPVPLFDSELLELMYWIADYYQSYLIQVIKTVIPPGITTGRVNFLTKKWVELAVPEQKALEKSSELQSRAPKQALILKILAEKRAIPQSLLLEQAETSSGTVLRLVERKLVRVLEKPSWRKPFPEIDRSKIVIPPKLLPQQEKVVKKVLSCEEKSEVFLLKGVTGSGKTEVYLRIIEEKLSRGKGAIVLVPEISLTPQMVSRFMERFSDEVAVQHSALSLGERLDEWLRIKRGEAKIVIGARSALFAPVKNLGIIIIDEEHESSYKQTEHPRFLARDVAQKRAEISGAVTVLGSATPSVESYFNALNGKYNLLELHHRVEKRPLPEVEIVDMRKELKKGNFSIFSEALQKNMERVLDKGEQVLLFLNRRGFAGFILCRNCGHVIKCRNCAISLTYHQDSNMLCCHHCNYQRPVPRVCPECNSKYIKGFGIGTEKVQQEVQKLFPGIGVLRLDADTTSKKGSHARILNQFATGKARILVGTQMIAKGHDYPGITLVGVITADISLNLPDFRSSERTFQLLTQVAGRTGRGEKKGLVIIQTYTPEHFSIQKAKNHDFDGFFATEIRSRARLGYPPFNQLINIILTHPRENVVSAAGFKYRQILERFKRDFSSYEVIGPSPAPISRLKGLYRWQIILKGAGEIIKEVSKKASMEFVSSGQFSAVGVNIDIDPFGML